MHVIFTGFSSAIAPLRLFPFYLFSFMLRQGLAAVMACIFIFFLLRFPHDLRFHDIFSRLMLPATCNDKIVKAGVDGVFIICMGQC